MPRALCCVAVIAAALLAALALADDLEVRDSAEDSSSSSGKQVLPFVPTAPAVTVVSCAVAIPAVIVSIVFAYRKNHPRAPPMAVADESK